MTTYSELVTQIRDYTETTSDVLSDTIVNDFIEHSEKRGRTNEQDEVKTIQEY